MLEKGRHKFWYTSLCKDKSENFIMETMNSCIPVYWEFIIFVRDGFSFHKYADLEQEVYVQNIKTIKFSLNQGYIFFKLKMKNWILL